MSGHWTLINGKWVAQDEHSLGQPTSRGIEAGSPPAGITRSRVRSNQRRFDLPSDNQIKALEKEDNDKIKAIYDSEKIVNETKIDLKTGKIKVDPKVLENRRIKPFGYITDERDITHIIPRENMPIKEEYPKTVEEIKEYYSKQEKEKVIIEPPSEGQLLSDQRPIEMKDLISRAINQVNTDRSSTRGRTF